MANPQVLSYELILLALVIGATIGTVIALRIRMAAMPQLVAARAVSGDDSPLSAMMKSTAEIR